MWKMSESGDDSIFAHGRIFRIRDIPCISTSRTFTPSTHDLDLKFCVMTLTPSSVS